MATPAWSALPGSAATAPTANVRLERTAEERALAGVCGGIARALGADVALVRIVALVLGAAGGVGIALYVVAAAGMAPAPRSSRRQFRSRLPMALGVVIIVAALVALTAAAGVLIPVGLMFPATLVGAGAALIWRRSGGEVRLGSRDRWVRNGVRAVSGVALVTTGVSLALAQSGGIGPALAAALAALAVAGGIGLLVAPRLRRARADADEARRETISSEERERVATQLHDSVLQTLALIQREPDPERARGLARRQDRDLRAWLYGNEDIGAGEATLAGAFRSAVADIEERYSITVDLVQPGDLPMDPSLDALVHATREAITNAAKHAGVDQVNVLVRVRPGEVGVFIRDRGIGFDPEAVPEDRGGLRDSIRGRISRAGGRVTVETAPGEGTDIELVVPRESRA